METSKELYEIISKDKNHCRIVDVGACNLLTDNMKYFAHDKDYEILLIEPDPRQYKLISNQLIENTLGAAIHLDHRAVFTQLGELEFLQSAIVGHSRIENDNFRRAKPKSINQTAVKVACDTLLAIMSDYFDNHEVDFIKIDVEGMDEMVIEQAIKMNPIYIMAEHQNDPLRIVEQTKLLKDYVKVRDFDDSMLWIGRDFYS